MAMLKAPCTQASLLCLKAFSATVLEFDLQSALAANKGAEGWKEAHCASACQKPNVATPMDSCDSPGTHRRMPLHPFGALWLT